MNSFRKNISLGMVWLLAVHPFMISFQASAGPMPQDAMVDVAQSDVATTVRGVELTGTYDDQTAEMRAERDKDRKAGFGEDGTPYPAAPFSYLPIVDDKLSQKTRSAPESKEQLRVIVYLSYLPHEQVFSDVVSARQNEVDTLEADRQALMSELKAQRVTGGKKDSDNYQGMRDISDAQRAAMRAINERTEALSLVLKNETTSVLQGLIDDSQAPVNKAIANLGGNVEFGTIAGNMVIATIPMNAVEELSKTDGILRIVEDSTIESFLTVADQSSMVDPADGSLIGLWDAGATGGIWDAAVIDSGIDLSHPFHLDDATRTNFTSLYVVAGVAASNYNETCCSVDDFQGHGSHVSGIVNSKGSNLYPGHLGMAFGAEKMVHLKAGWLNTAGTASMFWSDKYNLVERALNDNNALVPNSTFLDDVEGFNLSYGGSTSLDDTDGGRFWDSVVSSISDTVVTIAAGNSGPSNTLFSDPAVSYNAITVANLDDRNTTSRADDIRRFNSTVGPTANGRRKPDLAAPGTNIASSNNEWETQTDWVNASGTSMAAPMVLGVLINLMDAGVIDELRLKALIINTAQKNLTSMNFEADGDGWDPQAGYGAMNAYAAYFHRFDTHVADLAPRDTAGDFQLYMGSMQDEGAFPGEGRDRATMAWNRHATYLPASDPSTFYNLVDLNVRLYQESNNALIDFDTDVDDNVHQVRIGSGAGPTDVVINTYAWSTTFSHGDTTEEIALATEDGFTAVDHPSTFQAIANWPSSVEPNEVFEIEFWLNNNSVLASHNNSFNLELPTGWTLLSGTDTQNVGSIASGGASTHVNYTIRAAAVLGADSVVVAHSHSSYNEPYGAFNWNIGITVEVDNTAPNPNPMTFSTFPSDTSTSTISMTASFANDATHNPTNYYLDYTGSPSGGLGGTDSGWQASRNWVDAGLQVNDEYCYRAWARDSSATPNLTAPSASDCEYTTQAVPSGVGFGAVTTTSIAAFSTSTPNNLTLGLSGLAIGNSTASTNSGFSQNNNPWISNGLTPARGYTFWAQARNGDGQNTGLSTPSTRYTLANPPAVDSLLTDTDESIKVNLNPNGNSGQAQYFIQNTTAGTNSGWLNDTSWSSAGLACETFYNFQAKARNGDGIETIIVPLGLQTTGACPSGDTDSDGILDDVDNCTNVPNADQRDTNGDGFGNICDPDLNNDGVVNFVDFSLWTPLFNTACGDVDADYNGDGTCNFGDYSIMPGYFGQPPGPSAVSE